MPEDIPAPIGRVAIVPPAAPRTLAEVHREVDHLRAIATAPPSRLVRRTLFLWLRILVIQRKTEKESRVDLRVPIPLPIVGLLFPYRLPGRQALQALAVSQRHAEPLAAMASYLDSVMALEFVRVERERPGKLELVVIGLD